ncbi:MAG: HypC/HybG/HupF family hydrogenase formation chaperone [Propionibacteriaceae bacterium]|jgi:hydrogenase expression/formation protein HypC|nr:HypC/HybG/HupF family hydrogenase formation chaperone [Propionibacteriaceae bacterium]
MCLGVPAEVIDIVDEGEHLAKVDVGGVRRVISTALLTDRPVATGDWVLVHVGFAMSYIDEAEAAATLDQIQKLGQAWDDEIDAFKETAIV